MEKAQWKVVTLIRIIALRFPLSIAGHNIDTVGVTITVYDFGQFLSGPAEGQIGILAGRPPEEVIIVRRKRCDREQSDTRNQKNCLNHLPALLIRYESVQLFQRDGDEDVRHRCEAHHTSIMRDAVRGNDHREDHHPPPQHTESIRQFFETDQAQYKAGPEQNRQGRIQDRLAGEVRLGMQVAGEAEGANVPDEASPQYAPRISQIDPGVQK